MGYPAGTELPGHEFLCHRNLISCQVRSRLRLRGSHLGLFLSSSAFPTKKKKGGDNLLNLVPSVSHPASRLLGTGSDYREG